MGYAVFLKEPSSTEVCRMLGQAVAAAGKAPRYIVCNHGPQFYCDAFRQWCKRSGIEPPRYGDIGKHGNLAVIERLVLTLKTLLHCLPVPKILIRPCLPSYLLKPLWFMNSQMRSIQV